MNFLLDQDVYAVTEKFLRNLGHDVITAREINCSQVSDLSLLHKSQELKRILVTRDRDYGSLIFVMGLSTGVIYLRISPSNITDVHNQLEKVIKAYSEKELKKSFVVVEAKKYRFRRLNL